MEDKHLEVVLRMLHLERLAGWLHHHRHFYEQAAQQEESGKTDQESRV
jgi:hypothetical protein